MTTIELVRHAQAQPREGWRDRPDHDRPLSDTGRAQAEELGRAILAGGPVEGCYASPTVRCAQTLEPLAAATGRPIVDVEALGEVPTVPLTDGGSAWVASAWLGGRAIAFVDRLTAERTGQRIAICSHGDVVPALLAVLAGRDRLALADVRLDKGARITLRFEGSRCVEAVHRP